MKRIFFTLLFFIFVISFSLFAKESGIELKSYLSSMNMIVIQVEEAMRNFSMKILPAENAAEQLDDAIEKFEALKPPSLFSEDHHNILSSFKDLRDGLKLLSDGERDKSVKLIKRGADLCRRDT